MSPLEGFVLGKDCSSEKPMELKEAIILVLQEAGPEGLTVKELVQRIKKKKWWDWKNDRAGYDSVSAVCHNPRYRDVFAYVAPGTYALWLLQDDGFTPYERPAKPMGLKEAIIIVLQEAGPEGLHVKELVQRMKKKKWWDWKNDEAGYLSVSAVCHNPRYRDVFAYVAPGTFALWALQDDDFTPYEKPMTLKEAIIIVLQEAGPGGLAFKEIVQRIEKRFSWDWENDKQGYNSVSHACRGSSKNRDRNRDVFVRVAPGTYALWALQDDDFTPYENPMELKEAIVIVLQEAGPGGLTIKELIQRIKKKFSWDWENDKQGYHSVSATCRKYPDVFVKHSRGVFALKSLQEGEVEEAEGSSKALTQEKTDDDAERTAGGAKRAREAADGSADESDQITVNKKKKQVLEELQSNAVPTEDRRLLLYTNEQKETIDLCFQSVEGKPFSKGSADRCKGIEATGIGARPSETASEENSYSDLTFIRVSDYTNSELKAIADAENKKIGVQSHIFV